MSDASFVPLLPFFPAALRRYAVRGVPAPARSSDVPVFGDRLVVTNDGAGVAEDLDKQLIARGIPARVGDNVPADATSVVCLAGLRPVNVALDALALER